jgi:hypothetical protein
VVCTDVATLQVVTGGGGVIVGQQSEPKRFGGVGEADAEAADRVREGQGEGRDVGVAAGFGGGKVGVENGGYWMRIREWGKRNHTGLKWVGWEAIISEGSRPENADGVGYGAELLSDEIAEGSC